MTAEEERSRVKEFVKKHKGEMTVVGLAAATGAVIWLARYLLWRKKRDKAQESELKIAEQMGMDGRDRTSTVIEASGLFADVLGREAVEAAKLLASEAPDRGAAEGFGTVALVTDQEGRRKQKTGKAGRRQKRGI